MKDLTEATWLQAATIFIKWKAGRCKRSSDALLQVVTNGLAGWREGIQSLLDILNDWILRLRPHEIIIDWLPLVPYGSNPWRAIKSDLSVTLYQRLQSAVVHVWMQLQQGEWQSMGTPSIPEYPTRIPFVVGVNFSCECRTAWVVLVQKWVLLPW